MSAQEISDYLLGKGMGLAKAAELNGYPGPAHVPELTAQLDLTPDQKTKTEVLFKRMRARAISLGKELVEEERALRSPLCITCGEFRKPGTSFGSHRDGCKGQVRQVHLDAHVEQTALLTPAQVEKYNRLRGYGITGEQESHQPRQH